MKKWTMTPQLERAVESRITLLEGETKYMDDFLKGGSSSGSSKNSEDQKQDSIGTLIPRYFGQIDTFIANPQGVGVGILARMSETDPTVLSSLMLKSQMMISKIGEYQNDNEEIADFVRTYLTRMQGPTWKEALEAMSSFMPYGFSISEIGWGLNKKNQKVPGRVRTYHPSTLCFEVDGSGDVTPNGIIQFVIQNAQFSNPNQYFQYYRTFGDNNPFETPYDLLTPYRLPFINNYGLVRLPRSKCIHHVNSSMTSFGSPYGKACVRTAHLAWQLKVFFMKQMGVAGKRNAQPFIWGTAPLNNNKVAVNDPSNPNKPPRDFTPVQALTEILSQRENDDSIVTGPETLGYKIQAILNQCDLNEFLLVLAWLDTQIFRAFMLPSLIMTEGNAGSRSLGDKHFQIVDRVAETDADKFCEAIINQMVRPSIDQNFGEQEDYGHFAQRPQSVEERERLANIFSTMANAGWMVPTDQKDGDYVRSTMHFPEQDESFYATAMPNFDPADPIDPDGAGEDDLTATAKKTDEEKAADKAKPPIKAKP